MKKQTKSEAVPYKYNEDELIRQIDQYVASTYKKHYVGDNNVQALDLIFSAGQGQGFLAGNIIKYAARYGRKNGFNRDDVLKIVHYGLLLLYWHDSHNGDKNTLNGD